MYVFSADTFIYRPKVFYEAGMPLLGALHQAQPNIAHNVIAHLERAGLIWAVVTQNVDGLHQRAGSEKVYELHGHLRSATCIRCGHVITWDELEEKVRAGESPPLHAGCGGVFKPDAVFFGDPLPQDFHDCCREVSESGLLIVVGSSLEVSPVNYLPGLCKKLAIVNMGATMADHRADLKIEAGAGQTFAMLGDILRSRGVQLLETT